MKKLMLGVLVFTLVLTSCKKYDNEFAALKDQIAALATQVAGVSALQSQLTATTSQVTALQTAVAALPNPTASITALSTGLATANTNVAAIQASLTTLATAGTANKAVVDQLKLDLATLAATTKTNNDAAALASTAVLASEATLATKIATAQAGLNSITDLTSPTSIAAVVAALSVQLTAQQASIATILSNTSTYTGAVSLTSDAEVAFFKGKIAQMGLITGAVTVNPTAITTVADLNLITNKMFAITGALTVTGISTTALTFSSLTTVSGAVTVNGGNSITIANADISKIVNIGGALTYSLDGPISLPALTSVGGALTLTPYTTAVAAGTALASIGTTSVNITATTGAVSFLTLNGGAATTFAKATSIVMPANGLGTLTATIATSVTLNGAAAGALVLTAPLATTITITSPAAMTSASITAAIATSINLSGIGACTGALTIAAPLATSINLSGTGAVGGAITVTAPLATSIICNAASTAAITINAPVATSILFSAVTTGAISIGGTTPNTVAGTISFPNATGAGAGTIAVTSADVATSFSAPLLVNAGNITLNYGVGTGTVNLALANTTNAITVTGPLALVLPAQTSGTITCLTAQTVTLNSYLTAVPQANIPAVRTLTYGNVNATVDLSTFTNLVTASVTGKANTPAVAAAATFTTGAGVGALTTLTLGGTLTGSTVVAGNARLTSLTTSGIINDLTINNNVAITSITLGHSHLLGGPGSKLTVTNNTLLASLNTGLLDVMNKLVITDNPNLTGGSLASYHTLPTAGTVGAIAEITIVRNKLTGAFVPSAAATASTVFVQASLTNAFLASLKAYVASTINADGTARNAITAMQVSVDGDCIAGNGNVVDNFMSVTGAFNTGGNLRGVLFLDKVGINTGATIVNDVAETSEAVTLAITTNGINTAAEYALVK
ncbi:MAG: hypothetical protein NTV75_06595 [Bacteroidia bacterium]|nr:hypothetical protein [Bacteroidia bacterium]